MANGNKSSAWSQVFSFFSANPPAIPTLSKPSNGSLQTNYQPRLDWHGSAQAFQVQLANNSSFSTSSLILNVHVTLGTHYDLPTPLPANATYYWRVQAFDSSGQYSLWSPYLYFKTAMQPPALLAPANVASALTTRPTFSWGTVSGASGYKFQLSKSSSFSSTIVDTAITSPLYTPTTDLPRKLLLYWRVSATGNKPSAWSPVFSFTSADPPAVPALLVPSNNSLMTTNPSGELQLANSTPVQTWTSVTGATYYQLQVATNQTFSLASIITDATTTNSSRSISNSLAANTTFFWRVRSFDATSQYSSWSSVHYFRTAMTPPVLASPSDTSQALTTRPTFDWADVSGATAYALQVSTVSTFASTLLNTSVSASTYTASSDLPRSVVLYWRVSAKGNNPSDWSTIFSFTSANPPLIPSLISPLSNSLITGFTPTLDWNDMTGADHYQVRVATSNSFTSASLVYDQNVGISGLNISAALQANTTYYWQARSFAPNGQFSLWSAYRYFRTAMQTPALLAPALNAAITTVRPSFDWGDVNGASGYTIQISTHADFSTNLINTSPNNSTYTATVNLPRGVTLYWRVYAKGTNPSSWVMSSFTIQ
jgi:hypothetical protein